MSPTPQFKSAVRNQIDAHSDDLRQAQRCVVDHPEARLLDVLAKCKAPGGSNLTNFLQDRDALAGYLTHGGEPLLTDLTQGSDALTLKECQCLPQIFIDRIEPTSGHHISQVSLCSDRFSSLAPREVHALPS